MTGKIPISSAVPLETQSLDQVGKEDIVKTAQQTYVTPLEVQEHLHRVWENEKALLDTLLGSYPSPTATKRKSSPQMFFLNVLPVPPSRFRPVRTFNFCITMVLYRLYKLYTLYLANACKTYPNSACCISL